MGLMSNYNMQQIVFGSMQQSMYMDYAWTKAVLNFTRSNVIRGDTGQYNAFTRSPESPRFPLSSFSHLYFYC